MPPMQTVTLTVEGMSCNHCVGAIKDGLTSLPGVEEVAVDLATGKVEVKGYTLDAQYLVREIDALGYSASVRS